MGLANTFRAGNYAELVRQALIDEIGVDVPVEGGAVARCWLRPEQLRPVPVLVRVHWPRPALSRASDPEPWPEPEPDPWTQPGAPPDLVPTAEERTTASPTAPPAVIGGPPPSADRTASRGADRTASRGRRPAGADQPASRTQASRPRLPAAGPDPQRPEEAGRTGTRGRHGPQRLGESTWLCGSQRLAGRRGQRGRREHRDLLGRRSRRRRTRPRRLVPRRARGLIPGSR